MREEQLAKRSAPTNILEDPLRNADVHTRGTALGNSNAFCSQCWGTGAFVSAAGRSTRVCACVYRRIFRNCLRRYLNVERSQGGWYRCKTERSQAGTLMCGFKDVEYAADVDLTAKRVLSRRQYLIFSLYHSRRLDWHKMCLKLGLSHGDFFHAVYVVEAILGRAFSELRPYPLYPFTKYFAGASIAVSQFGKPTGARKGCC